MTSQDVSKFNYEDLAFEARIMDVPVTAFVMAESEAYVACPITGCLRAFDRFSGPTLKSGAWPSFSNVNSRFVRDCTGHIDGVGLLSHDGDTCPIHEV